MEIKLVGVIGAGQMGNGIAQVAAQNGYQVLMMDVSGASLEKGLATISSSCDRMIKKATLTEADKKNILEKIKTSQKMSDLKDCDVVIEAATENIDLKLKIFKEIDEVAKAQALLVSNTSSISITKIAGVTKRPSQVAGMHFMNPVPLMKLVEGIRGLQTSDKTFSTIKDLAEKMGKVFVESTKDMPGLICSQLHRFIN